VNRESKNQDPNRLTTDKVPGRSERVENQNLFIGRTWQGRVFDLQFLIFSF
jgi:hypothetical protein